MLVASMAATPKPGTSAPPNPLLTGEDFERYLIAHAATIAPSDVTALVGHADVLRRRLVGERSVHPQLAAHARIALELVTDHSRGACPQIPYQTVALLATALLYYLAPMDVIPDFIPGAGTADDALVLEIAWRLAAAGIQRYVDWKETTSPAAPAPARPARTTTRGRAPARKPPSQRR
jgi:uncharacterized membrane protein YkvA (DUF1232 family)